MNEATVTQHVLWEAAKLDINLMRNNVGACMTDEGRLIRYGLMNESAKQNDKFKSSDYIGITPVRCFVDNLGLVTLGVFTAIEMKETGWKFSQNDKRAVAQSAFHDIVRSYGGFAGFATEPGDVRRIIKGVR